MSTLAKTVPMLDKGRVVADIGGRCVVGRVGADMLLHCLLGPQ